MIHIFLYISLSVLFWSWVFASHDLLPEISLVQIIFTYFHPRSFLPVLGSLVRLHPPEFTEHTHHCFVLWFVLCFYCILFFLNAHWCFLLLFSSTPFLSFPPMDLCSLVYIFIFLVLICESGFVTAVSCFRYFSRLSFVIYRYSNSHSFNSVSLPILI